MPFLESARGFNETKGDPRLLGPFNGNGEEEEKIGQFPLTGFVALTAAKLGLPQERPMPLSTLSRLLAAIACRLRRRPETRDGQRATQPPSRFGPPAIAFARDYCRTRQGIEIDDLETEMQVRTSGLAVRAWLVFDLDDLPADIVDATVAAERKLAMLTPRARQIFYLAASYGLPLAGAAQRLGLSRREARRELLRAIACLDGRSL